VRAARTFPRSNFTQLATSLAALADKGILTPDDDLEGWVRDLADAPGLPDALKGLPRTKGGTSPAPAADPRTTDASTAKGRPQSGRRGEAERPYTRRGRRFSRVPSAFEAQGVRLHGVPSRSMRRSIAS